METIECKISKIMFPKPGQPPLEDSYAIVLASLGDGTGVFSVKGCMPGVRVSASVRLTGEWKPDKYGRAFVISSYEEIIPTGLRGIENYLSCGLIKGIGPSTAARIVKKFGERTLEILDEDPSRIHEVKGIGKKKAASIIESWGEQKSIREVMVFLKTYDIPNGLAGKIYRKYGCQSIDVMKSNPYVLADELEGVGFITADKAAMSLGIPRTSQGRLNSGVMYAIRQGCEKNGHVFLEEDELVEAAGEILNNGLDDSGVTGRDEILRTINSLAGDRKLVRDGENGQRIYLPLHYNSERSVAARLTVLARTEDRARRPVDFGSIEKECGIVFDPAQKEAIALAADSHVCVITGGPGTGKTTTMQGVIRDAVVNKRRVLLAAPTGRAAKRLSETTGMDARTIHRLLEYRPGDGFTKNEDDPLSGDLLVVDESSMIDVTLMCCLLKAVPKKMRVVFVGDVDQLPSVGPGNVLRDIIESGTVPVVRLTKIFRQAQGSLIVHNAHAINEGRAPKLQGMLSPGAEDFCFIEMNDVEKIQKNIVTLVSRFIPETFGVRRDRIQVLSPMRRGPLGTEELNRLIQESVNPSDVSIRRGTVEFRKGDRVMQTRNNYEDDVYNGDIGTVVDVDRGDRTLTVDFDGKTVTREGDELDSIDLAYATTIHKSQGSEYPFVIIPATMGHYIMLQRNLLYTAVTRAKTRCVIIGERKALMTMVGNNTVRKRNTALAEALADYQGRTLHARDLGSLFQED